MHYMNSRFKIIFHAMSQICFAALRQVGNICSMIQPLSQITLI